MEGGHTGEACCECLVGKCATAANSQCEPRQRAFHNTCMQTKRSTSTRHPHLRAHSSLQPDERQVGAFLRTYT
jgi:hypothetical protein